MILEVFKLVFVCLMFNCWILVELKLDVEKGDDKGFVIVDFDVVIVVDMVVIVIIVV